jgi:DNA-binding transcriptional LysR family regulator
MPTPLPPFDLDLLRVFVAVVDNGGFTRAAERVGRTQSTISLAIKRLEEGLGNRLFDRQPGRPLALTAVGETLLTYARPLLKLADEARLRLLEPETGGTVRLGTPEDFATTHLPDVLARFARAHPRVSLEVNCDFTLNLLDGFSKGQYDLVLLKREPQGPAGRDERLARGVGLGGIAAACSCRKQAHPAGLGALPGYLPEASARLPGFCQAAMAHHLHKPEPGGIAGSGSSRARGDRFAHRNGATRISPAGRPARTASPS